MRGRGEHERSGQEEVVGGWRGGGVRRETRFVAVVVQSINHLLTVICI